MVEIRINWSDRPCILTTRILLEDRLLFFLQTSSGLRPVPSKRLGTDAHPGFKSLGKPPQKDSDVEMCIVLPINLWIDLSEVNINRTINHQWEHPPRPRQTRLLRRPDLLTLDLRSHSSGRKKRLLCVGSFKESSLTVIWGSLPWLVGD